MIQKDTDPHKKHEHPDDYWFDPSDSPDATPRPPRDEDGVDDEEFDRLLEEFIQSQLEEDNDRQLRMGEIELIVDHTTESDKKYSPRTQFSVDEGSCLLASVVCMGYNRTGIVDRWVETFFIELLSPEGETFAQFEKNLALSTEEESRLLFHFDLSSRNSALEGDWLIRLTPLSHTNDERHKTITYFPYPQIYSERFEVNNYLLFRLDECNPEANTPPPTYVSIDPRSHNDYYIGLCCMGKPSGEGDRRDYEYELYIKASTGLVRHYQTGTFTFQYDEENNPLYGLQVTVDFSTYGTGDYTVEIWFLGEKMIDAPLHVGEEQPGEYNLYTIQTRPPVGNVKAPSPAGRPDEKDALDSLQEMIGLDTLKQSIARHLNYVKLLTARKEAGLKATIPPLHMVFTGNPGTGKTTVADFIGEIYHKMGLLEKGHVVRTDRSKLVGKWIGDTEQKTEAAIEAAKGGVLFIDEAYNLFTNDKDGDRRDYGNRVIETLLPRLSDDSFGSIVILAGYPAEMEQLMESNPGLKSRFPFTFHFEDYTPDELLEIALLTTRREGYEMTDEARDALFRIIREEYRERDRHFGNARYVNRLITSKILPAMATRLAEAGLYDSPTLDHKALVTIEREDIPQHIDERSLIVTEPFDEAAIDDCLARLDRMIGLANVKTAIHNLVKVARLLHRDGKNFFGEIPLKWSFAGNTGTGKSTVAEIMTDLLKAMNILDNGTFTEIKGEQLYNVPDYKVDEVLQEAMKRSQQGLLFIDGDSPKFKNTANTFDSEQLRIKLAEYTSTLPGAHALIIAENRAPRQELVEQLIGNGAPEVDHTLLFEDYTQDELLEILKQMLADKGFDIEREAEAVMRRYIKYLAADRHSCYANARTMKIISRTIIHNAYVRLSDTQEASPRSTILPVDVACFDTEGMRPRHTVGFC